LRRNFLASEHRWPAESIVDGPLLLIVLIDARSAIAATLHGFVNQLPRRVGRLGQRARRLDRRVVASDRGQLALELLELELQLSQRLCDLLVHGS
jgi:hypothetical protein